MRSLAYISVSGLVLALAASAWAAEAPAGEPRYAAAFSDAGMKEWTTVSGAWELAREKEATHLRCAPSDGGLVRLVTGGKEWTDYSVEVKARADKWLSDTRGDYGLIVRYVDPSNYYLFLYDSNPDVKALIIQKKVAGKLVTLAKHPFDYQLGRWYTFRGVVRGDTLVFLVDGRTLLTATATEIPKGPAGLLTWFADVRYDAFRVAPAEREEPK